MSNALSKPIMSDEVSGFLSLVGEALGFYGNAQLALLPIRENNVGGTALSLMSLISMDLKSGRNYGIANTAERYFGSLDDAYGNLGLVACTSLGGVSLMKLAAAGQMHDLSHPLWIKVIANLGPYLAATGIDTPEAGATLKRMITERLGDKIVFSVPSQEEGKASFKAADSVRVSQQVALLVGASMMMGFSLYRNDDWTRHEVMNVSIPQVGSALLNIVSSGKALDADSVRNLFGHREAAPQPQVLTDKGLQTTLGRRQMFRALAQGVQEIYDVLCGYTANPDLMLENMKVLTGAPNQRFQDALSDAASRQAQR